MFFINCIKTESRKRGLGFFIFLSLRELYFQSCFLIFIDLMLIPTFSLNECLPSNLLIAFDLSVYLETNVLSFGDFYQFL
jgi:hypothetical protein